MAGRPVTEDAVGRLPWTRDRRK